MTETKQQNPSIIKHYAKKVLRFLGYIALFFLFISLVLSISFVQTTIGNYVTKSVNEDFNTNIVINKVDLSWLGRVQLKNIEIRDHHQDTLIFVKNLSTSLVSAKRILENEVKLKRVSLEGVEFFIKTYKGETDDNLIIFTEKFDDGKPRDSLTNPFLLYSTELRLKDLHFKLTDANKRDSLDFEAFKVGGSLKDFQILGPDFSSKIRGLHLTDFNGLEIKNFTTDFTYTKKAMEFLKTTIETDKSSVKGDVNFSYKREDLAEFNDKVLITAKLTNSRAAINDLRKFYEELNGNDVLTFTGNLRGTLNNFKLRGLNLSSTNNINISGDFLFKNTINTERGFAFESDLKKT